MSKLRTFYERKVTLHTGEDSFTADNQLSRWSNKDLDPVPRAQKTWEWYHVGGFWIAEGFAASYIQTASASIALGLNPGLVVVALLVGNLIMAVACAGSGYIGAKYSINYPVIMRASFGMWGSYLPIVMRAAINPVWYGINTYLGSLSVQAMIEAIWPSFSSWHHDALPASAEITAAQLLCFAIFWLASIPLLFVNTSNLRWVFLVKIVIMPFLGVSLFTWAVTASHGFGHLLSIPSKIENGQSVGYAFCYAMSMAMGNMSSYALNVPDILRYANKPRQITITQAVALPVCMTLIYFLGVVLAASSQVVYGHIIWNPLQLVLLWDDRAAKFFVGLLFAFAIMTSSVAGGSIPFGNDMMGLFPKYMNVRRGQLLCAVVGFAVCPWKIEASAVTFLNFVHVYTNPILGPIAGVLLCDCFLIRRRSGLSVHHLYKPHGIYWYRAGWNIRAVLAYLVGMVPQLPDLAYQVNPKLRGGSRSYLNFWSLGWLEGLIFSFLVYYALYLLKPFPSATDEDDGAASASRETSQGISDEAYVTSEEVK